MEKARAMQLGQPYRTKLELRQAKRSLGRGIILHEGKLISEDFVCGKLDDNHYSREALFHILNKYLHNNSLNKDEFAVLKNVLFQLGYSDSDVDAIGKFLMGLKASDGVFIKEKNESMIIHNISDAPRQDYIGFVRDCLPLREEQLAVLEYIKEGKTENLNKLVEAKIIEIIDFYIEDTTVRERLIILLEVVLVV